MVQQVKVVIDGITVQDDLGTNPGQVLSIEYKKEDATPISDATIECFNTVSDYIDIKNNLDVEIYVSFDGLTYIRKFYGYLVEYKIEKGIVKCNCKNRMYDLVRRNVNTIYDSAISPTAGIISEIAKDLIETYGGLTASVQNSGTTQIIEQFKCPNTDIFERLEALKEALDWTLYYDDTNDVVHFEPRMYVDSGITLQTSDNIYTNPEWTPDMSYMINRLTAEGATTSTLLTKSGQIGVTSGFTAAYIELDKTPDSAELLYDSSNPPTTQQTGGSKDGSSGNSFWIDSDNKKIMPVVEFTTNYYAIVNYYWSAPTPIQMENADSIDNYGLFEKKITLSDVTSVADAETRATNILAKRSTPFIVCDMEIDSSLNLDTGQAIIVQDDINELALNGTYMISEITFKYPSITHEIKVGDKVWRLIDWQDSTETRIKRLEEQITGNEDILRQLVQASNTSATNFRRPEPRYRKVIKQEYNTTYGGSIWGNPIKPWGEGKWGTHEEIFDPAEDHFVEQYQDTYTETFLDDDFEDTTNTTATWDGTLTFSTGEVAQSESIDFNNGTITQATLTADNSTNLEFYMTADGTNWESVTSGVSHTFTNTGTDLRWKAVSTGSAELNSITIGDYH